MWRVLHLALLVGCVADAPGIEGQHDEPEAGSGSGGGSQQTTMTLSKYFDEIAAVHCEQAFSCRDAYPPERGTFETTWGASVPACEASLITGTAASSGPSPAITSSWEPCKLVVRATTITRARHSAAIRSRTRAVS
jgi:hypothetical protein